MKRKRKTIIRTGLPQTTWRLLNVPKETLLDKLNHLLLVLPMIQSQRGTITEARDFVIKHTKKRSRK